MEKPDPIPLAYFITFACYGTHLHGHESGSVDRFHNRYGAPFIPPDMALHQKQQKRMNHPPYLMNHARAVIVMNAFKETSLYRQWILLAAHVRSTHVHAVVQASTNPEKVMNDFKSYASRALNRAGYEHNKRKRWARHGSTKYIWNVESLERVIHYVLHEQGDPMVVYDGRDSEP